MSATETPANPLTSFTCNTCKSIFENSASQRMHFKTDLHVVNVKKRLESLISVGPPLGEVQTSDPTRTPMKKDSGLSLEKLNVSAPKQQIDSSLDGYDDKVREQKHINELPKSATDVGESSSFDNVTSDDEEIVPLIFNPSICLLCVHHSSDLNENLVHMQAAHGLEIPEPDLLIHLESFIHYLFTIIFEFNECLFCGIMKGSVKGVQQHMLTKGHAKVSKPEKGSDYRDFYDLSGADEADDDVVTTSTKASSIDRDNLTKSEDDFVRLSSGRTLGNRSTARGSRQISYPGGHEKSSQHQVTTNDDVTSLSNVEVSEAQPRAKGQVIARKNDDKGLVGVPEWQRRSIRATEKKMQKVELRARNRYEAAVQRAADQRADLRQRQRTRVADSV